MKCTRAICACLAAAFCLPPWPGLAGQILNHDVTVTTRDPRSAVPRHTENLLDTMDVYALSPHAAALRLPRLVTPQLAAVIRSRGSSRRGPSKDEWRAIIAAASAAHGLPQEVIAAVIRTESDYDPKAVSTAGAQGAMQLMPGTQAELGVIDPYDARANVMAGCAYLKAQLDRFGSLELALAAYNAGPGAVRKYRGIPPYAETRRYVSRVMSLLRQ